MTSDLQFAANLHSSVPPNWYYQSIRENPLQEFWHKTRFRKVRQFASPVDGSVLDIGSADGVFTKQILEATGAVKIIGIDVLQTSVDWANGHWKDPRMTFKLGDANKLSFASDSFSAVFALEMLEHVQDPDQVLREIKRVLKRGGYAILLVPTDVWYFKFLWDYFWTKFRGKVWQDTHLQSFTGDSLVRFVKRAGFKVLLTDQFMFGMLQIIKIEKR